MGCPLLFGWGIVAGGNVLAALLVYRVLLTLALRFQDPHAEENYRTKYVAFNTITRVLTHVQRGAAEAPPNTWAQLVDVEASVVRYIDDEQAQGREVHDGGAQFKRAVAATLAMIHRPPYSAGFLLGVPRTTADVERAARNFLEAGGPAGG